MANHRLPAAREYWAAIANHQADRLDTATLRCPDCRQSWDELYASGLAGCPRCFEVFRLAIGQFQTWQRPLDVDAVRQATFRAIWEVERQVALDSEFFETADWLTRRLSARPTAL
jgi:hypothetical protein